MRILDKKEQEEAVKKSTLTPTNEELSDAIAELGSYIESLENRIAELGG